MQHATFLHISREGWPFVGLALVLVFFIYSHYGVLAACPVFLVAIWLFAFFHEPDRKVPAEPLAIITPVDGRVISVGTCNDSFLHREAIRISVRVGWLGAYLLRSPSEGTVLEIPADAEPEYKDRASWVRTDESDDVVFVVSAGSLLGARPCLTRYGERVGQGRRCGVRRLARCVDIYLPATTRAEVEPGQKVLAGGDVLATLVRKTASNGK